MFLSWLVSRFIIRDGKPVMRAALCVVISVMIAWGLSFGLNALMPSRASSRPFEWSDFVVQIGTPLAVFLWEWWSFHRHWIDDEDIGEVFE